jgi:hypothetical protein
MLDPTRNGRRTVPPELELAPPLEAEEIDVVVAPLDDVAVVVAEEEPTLAVAPPAPPSP